MQLYTIEVEIKLLYIFVDLRWNNVGLLGGRAILEMLQTNKTVSRLELAGNNIPSDILKSIGNLKTVYITLLYN